MKVLKPDWINHNGMPICSIDIHPDGSRVATGGQGEDSGRIVIWNMAPVVSEKMEVDENVPRMLCQLDNHLACVNCVRWSTSGKYLASGGDDKLVMVWTISKSSSGNSVFGGKSKVNLEGWRCVFTLRGHQGDVLDMAWSPHDHWLATCSVDNTVIIWRSDNLPEVVTVLKGHTGLVKGVSWDPVGKYLSSQSDDRSVRIWRTGDWHQEAVIKQPFEKCSGTTLVLRLSWSPDGQYLVTAHAMNGAIPTAQIIERDGWTHDKDFVGHKMAVTCVRFSGYIMEAEKKGKAARACACAIGSRDRSVSVWVTSLTRPVIVLADLFQSPVLDLSWGPRGLCFMACSGDGTTAYLEFTEQEIGTPITETDKGLLFEKMYGKAHIDEEEGGMVVVENPEVLQQHNCSASPQATQATPSSDSPVARVCPPTNKQIETRTADGRRRITPVYIPPAPDTGDEVVPFGTDSVSFSSQCVTNKSRIVVEKRDDIVVTPNVTTPSGAVKASTPAVVKGSGPVDEAVSPTPAGVAPSLAPAQTSTTPPKPPQVQPQQNCTEGGFSSLVTWTERAEWRRKRNAAPSLGARASKSKRDDEGARGGPCVACKRHRLAPLSIASNQTVTLVGCSSVIRVENNVSRGSYGSLACVRCYANPQHTKPSWELMLGSEATGCAGCSLGVAVSCSDLTLHLLNAEGEHYLPPVALSSLPALLSATSSYLVCVTCDGGLYLWAFRESTVVSLVADKSIAPLLSAHEGSEMKIKDCFVSEEGEPMLALSSGKAYAFSLRHNTWLLLGNSTDPVVRNAFQSFKSSLRNPPSGLHTLPLKALQSAAFNGVNMGTSRLMPGSDVGPMCTLAHLDTQLSCARVLKSKHEYRFWLLTLVRFLLQQGMEGRLRRICEELLGPRHSGSLSSHKWEDRTLGISKHALLREVLTEMSSNLRSQRIYIEFKNQLDGCQT